ncbi:hypothetical protein DL770_008853 [Monosporascus sp. CRB-9-2]|nr:hypothetical protein DL770_008853 [Monosporascus sp. CRB-9-2]
MDSGIRSQPRPEHREVLLKELDFFWQTPKLEQRRRLSPDLPTLDEYITCRMGTSAVGVTCFVKEYAQGTRVPVHVLDDPGMK